MRDEALFLQQLRSARENVKNVVDGPDQDIDRIIRSVLGNDGKVSNKLVKEFPILENRELADGVVAAISNAFAALA